MTVRRLILAALAAAAGSSGAAAQSPPALEKPASIFAKMPSLQTIAPPAALPIPPTDEGFYTLLDLIRGNPTKAPPGPYPRFGLVGFSFSNANWGYVDQLDEDERDFAESLKRIAVGDDWMVTTGGEFRWRYANEVGSRLSGRNNVYDLYRTRAYADVYYRDWARVYAEFLHAESVNQDLRPIPGDINRGDIHEGFAEVRIAGDDENKVWVRGGIQELIYGSQRLISPIEWGNNRRTFLGLKAYNRSEHLDLDAFVASPMVPNPNNLDSHDNNVLFSGVYLSYKPEKGKFWDLYALNLDNQNPVTGADGARGGRNITTLGGRAFKNSGNWLYDFEAAVQAGRYANQSHFAAMSAAGVGYHFLDVLWNPQIWLFHEYGSGDNNPGRGGSHGTFDQLFAFGHYYFGAIDVIGRQNIHDINLQGTIYPSDFVTFNTQFHVFQLANRFDALYGTRGEVLRRDRTGAAGTDVGQELDLLVNFHLTKHQDLIVGYSHLWAGDYIRRTGSGRDLDFTYVQYNYRW